MRRLLFALPFLLAGFLYLFMDFRETPMIILTLGWLAFALEYRYDGESTESDELVALAISMSVVLIPLHEGVAEILALFIFILVMTALFIKFKMRT
ncbi:hypothetical protein FH039_05460 [Thermococcus indicus]|uniref:Uncharacterized protein n=1 Tax=Thermococcus indicus TaxID=2586643 RepID=A0A4Y5SL81_9EURY|nr:hypothetical protein [Thermococcus indicus]QDA31154.1 hypothetical protein FH039_05460 [Thermococcus indicus]